MMVTVLGVGDGETPADSTTCVRDAGHQRVSASNTEFFVLAANSRAEGWQRESQQTLLQVVWFVVCLLLQQ